MWRDLSWRGLQASPGSGVDAHMLKVDGCGVNRRLNSEMLVHDQAPKNTPKQDHLKDGPGLVRWAETSHSHWFPCCFLSRPLPSQPPAHPHLSLQTSDFLRAACHSGPGVCSQTPPPTGRPGEPSRCTLSGRSPQLLRTCPPITSLQFTGIHRLLASPPRHLPSTCPLVRKLCTRLDISLAERGANLQSQLPEPLVLPLLEPRLALLLLSFYQH